MKRSGKLSPEDRQYYSYYNKNKGIAFAKNRSMNNPSNNPNKPRVNYGTWFKDENTQIKWYTDPKFKTTKNGINKFMYYYKIIPSSYIRNTYYHRSSIIPYIIVDNERYWLLGSFADFNFIKTDFGGKCNRGEEATTCSLREMSEETNNILNKYMPKLLLNNDKVTIYEGTNRKDRRQPKVAIFMVELDVDNMEIIDEIQKKIEQSKSLSHGETFGKLGFYLESDILKQSDKNNNKILTSVNLTDFVDFLYYKKNRRY